MQNKKEVLPYEKPTSACELLMKMYFLLINLIALKNHKMHPLQHPKQPLHKDDAFNTLLRLVIFGL